jgi:hypothetical protein
VWWHDGEGEVFRMKYVKEAQFEESREEIEETSNMVINQALRCRGKVLILASCLIERKKCFPGNLKVEIFLCLFSHTKI